LAGHAGAPVHPLRFRGNLYVEGLPAWSEKDWIGREIRAGSVRFKAIDPIDRCAATNVNPATAIRDMTIPEALTASYGEPNCGVYLTVIASGEMKVGDEIGPA